jgi:chromopyrrolic acid synthase
VSVFDLPRLHFAGVGITRLPTGPRSGLLDLGANAAVVGCAPFPVHRPAQEYHDYLDRQGIRFEPDGTITPDGRFGLVKGWNFGGNGHFWVEATVVGCERSPRKIDTTDLIVGRQLDMWGHYNDYPATTANRARVFDVDPASNWTTAVMVGRLSLGRLGRSHEVGYLMTGDVSGVSSPRWQNSRHILQTEEHPLAREFVRSVVHQFVVDKTDRLDWLNDAAASPGVSALRHVVDTTEFGGLVVQFALFNMATPTSNDVPDRWDLRGTIAPWRPQEMRTYPAGRLLTGRELRRGGWTTPLHNLTVHVSDRHVTANMITAVPVTSRAAGRDSGPTHRLGPRLDVGDLQLRTDTGRLLAVFPRPAYLSDAFRLTSGLLSVPRADGRRDDPDEQLRLQSSNGTVLLTEEEITVQSDQASLFLEHPNAKTGQDFAIDVSVRSFLRGRPAKIDLIEVHQFFNPRGLPLDPRASKPETRATDVAITEVAAIQVAKPREYWTTCMLSTDQVGHGRLAIRGARAGATQVLLLPEGTPLPCDPSVPGSAALGYDNDDQLGYWSSAGFLSVRVLPDNWHLEDIPSDEITFELVYREVFAYFELMYSFMKAEVMSLADISKVTTYARLIWLMCDPRNKDKTFYMPSTRDMTEPQANLLLKFMQATEYARQMPPSFAAEKPAAGAITTRDELCRALCQAATIELAVMLQYLYALWSIPTYSAGLRYVERGEWTPEQLRLMCGDGPHALDGGLRGNLFSVAREEMIHFLVINNIIMATGQPFHLPRIDFGAVNSLLPVPLDFCLEAFGLGSLQRFIALEQPYGLVREISGNNNPGTAARNGSLYPYGSLSELYSAIREAIQLIPNVFMVNKNRGGGEHHLFMRKSLNATHPDYQLEVDDVTSAVFAIDFVTEHGEGNVIKSVMPSEESHFDTFLHMSELLTAEYTIGPSGRRMPWNPAYPVIRNPTLQPGNATRDVVTNEQARAVMELFNRSYAMTMQLMIQHFGLNPDASLRRSRLMNAALDLMTGVLRPVAEHIVTLPSGRPGRTAGPSFEMDRELSFISRPDVAAKWIATQLSELSVDAVKIAGLTDIVPQLLRFFADQFRTMDPREV